MGRKSTKSQDEELAELRQLSNEFHHYPNRHGYHSIWSFSITRLNRFLYLGEKYHLKNSIEVE